MPIGQLAGEKVRIAGLEHGDLAEIARLLRRGERGVRVGGTDDAELERVHAELGLELQPELQGRATVLVLEHLLGLGLAQVEVALVPGTVIGKLVVGRKDRVCFTVALDLCHFVQGLLALAALGVVRFPVLFIVRVQRPVARGHTIGRRALEYGELLCLFCNQRNGLYPG